MRSLITFLYLKARIEVEAVSKAVTALNLAELKKDFKLSKEMGFGLTNGVANLFSKLTTVLNYSSVENTNSADLGGAQSLFHLYANLENNFSPTARFKKGKRVCLNPKY